MQTAKLLIVDDDPDVLLAAKLLLKRHIGQVDIEKNPDRLPFLLGNTNYDAVLLDMNFTRDVSSGKEGFDWLDRILDADPSTRVVLFTAYGDVEMAVRAIKAGAADFVLKPWENDKLVEVIKTAIDSKKASEGAGGSGAAAKKGGAANAGPVIAQSAAMRQILDTVERVAPTDANILILGENGTGKDVLAREIHRLSTRRDKPFVAADLGALPESLFESELFGHVRGAFTDARDDRAGRFEEAQGGTIFLDEIGNVGLSQQARLLTVLQQRQVMRVGSNKPRPIDVRLVCATNADLNARVLDRSFRQDLLYRINTIELHIPPLRQRPDDIGPLAEHFLRQYRKQYNRPVGQISPDLLRHLKQYAWPGNVRELQHAIERAVILARGNTLTSDDFFFGSTPAAMGQTMPGNDTLQIESMERRMIQQAMQKHGGNITDVARELGLSRQALYRRMEKYGL
ncbi:two component, sigma54 specific, transcriptional regulator, Fis family [Fibrella aestuarina BUZ 2]|uniref:Two component, sigma54 specific, transcriptional regulator, Fis family n=1 Tax=Fibrella aestuarina BUZ 2 TaxID=1166018 RepID=I0K6E4_9BACT|nr:sigma-54 dependent transcriptional regulator [Fibrella aestuarina]CCG99697.1 two component, sigma54 specific, transcriptional regulator, Fis family [Fibrella aestuarina BUZ 2]